MPDTLKAQHTAFLTAGRVLYSDMGRILCSIIADTCGWHDTICGHRRRRRGRCRSTATARYQELRNDFHRNARDNFLVELGKCGLGKRDLVPNVNLFSQGRGRRRAASCSCVAGHSRPGATSSCAPR